MKMKNIYSAVVALALFSMASCDYNEQFDGFEDLAQPTDVRQVTYTMTEDDYSSISGLAGSYFSADQTAQDYIPSFLDEMYPTVDNGSSVKLTYNYKDALPEYLTTLAVAGDYTVSSSDYTTVWGDIAAEYFTPERPMKSYAAKILASAFPDAVSGDVVVLEYDYSASEPSTGGEDATVSVTEIYEDFSFITTSSETTEILGWINYAEAGSTYWVNKVYSSNGYVQCSAYGASSEVVAWLITPIIDLSAASAPQFSFDICLGYANGAEFQVLISEDFNGSESGCTSATWEDVTSNFAWETPSSGYGSMAPTGLMDLSDYVGKKIYVAFKYSGDTSKTTTFQIDNIELGETSSIVEDITLSEVFAESLDGWDNQTLAGTLAWSQASYGSDSYAKASAYGYSDAQEAILVSPSFTVADGARFSFDILAGYYTGDGLAVLISNDYDGDATAATWTDISSSFAIPQEPTSTWGSFETSGAMYLSDFEGQDVNIAFKYYNGDDSNITTTYEITNVLVSSLSRSTAASSPAKVASRAIDGVHTLEAVYTYNGTTWAAYDSALAISSDNFSEMGLTTFSSSALPSSYIPQWLNEQLPYAQEADAVGVVYTYSSAREAAEYTFTGGTWVEQDGITALTDQFVKSNDEWSFDPSVVINLTPGYSAAAATYYQVAVDWVWANIDQAQLGATSYGMGYVSSYGTNEYYTGSSAYYSNVDMRVSSARSQYPAGYEAYSDDEVTALMTQRLTEVFEYVLASLHSDAVPVDGIDVIYTVNFALYTGTTLSDVSHTMQYLVTGNGQFEYIEDSLQAL